MKKTRYAFTLVELLVVITIIGILMGLLLPAIQAVRESGRKTQCASQIRNLALAVKVHDTNKNRLPGYVERYGLFTGGPMGAGAVDPSDPNNHMGAVPRHVKIGTWAVALLPSLDAQPTFEHWNEDRYPIIADAAGDLGNTGTSANPSGLNYHTLAAPNLAIFQCPSNPVSEGEFAKNSYIANNGMYHRVGPAIADTAVSGVTFQGSQDRANGAMNNKYNVVVMSTKFVHSSEGGPVRMDDFKDGQGNTILFSENVQALPWHVAGFQLDATMFETAAATDTEVLFNTGSQAVDAARHVHGMVWHYEDPDPSNAGLATLWNTNGTAAAVVPGSVKTLHKINGGGTTASEEIFTKVMTAATAADLARPSSAHVGGVNCGMADGQVRFILETIDYRVYQALCTPRGKSSNVPWQEFVLTDEAIQ